MSAGGGLRKRVEPFVQVRSKTVNHAALSFRALGVLTYLLDKPEGWEVRAEAMAKAPGRQGREGREAVRTALRELAAAGYYRLERRQLRSGRHVMGTALSEAPIESWAQQATYFDGKAVPVVEQADGSYLVRYPDGTTLPEDCPPPAPADPAEPTGDGFPGSGFPVPGKAASGDPAPGSASPYTEDHSDALEEEEPTPPTPPAPPPAPSVPAPRGGGDPNPNNPNEAALDVAALKARKLRPGWSLTGIQTAMGKQLDAGVPAAVVAAAIVAAAQDVDAKTPGRIVWHLDAAAAAVAKAEQRTAQRAQPRPAPEWRRDRVDPAKRPQIARAGGAAARAALARSRNGRTQDVTGE